MDHSMHDMANMSASASSTIMSMAASATMSMASATATAATTSTHDMADMDMSDMSSMSMTMGTFHWSSSGDGIWFDAWVPKSEGAYIGACFGLFFLPSSLEDFLLLKLILLLGENFVIIELLEINFNLL